MRDEQLTPGGMGRYRSEVLVQEIRIRGQLPARAINELLLDTAEVLARVPLPAGFTVDLTRVLLLPDATGDGNQFHWDEAARERRGIILKGFPSAGAGSPGRGATPPGDPPSPFYFGSHEVTQQQYLRVMKENPGEFGHGGLQGPRVAGQATEHFPVDSVNWRRAVGFCQRLLKLPAEQPADRRYRLSTEAE